MASSSRDDFSEAVKRMVAARVNHRCSRPDCCAQTRGPRLDESKSINIGVAAHITAAAQGGARYDHKMSAERRAGIINAIWLCQNCAKLIDNDPVKFSADVLRGWKTVAEREASKAVGKTTPADGGREPDKARREAAANFRGAVAATQLDVGKDAHFVFTQCATQHDVAIFQFLPFIDAKQRGAFDVAVEEYRRCRKDVQPALLSFMQSEATGHPTDQSAALNLRRSIDVLLAFADKPEPLA